ncbi:conserved hypothetical protein [Frankia sp. AiPs1]|uniref:hypothetical protein n=1 Tax=Frankia sp. AiPa1 TaxID=573492 RepID=UPI00202B6261|nr:hypothetical protein [Frankia sp. AiPa1]MCL9762935.1 hypothetical protein [Frankia sp. AiPa1]
MASRQVRGRRPVSVRAAPVVRAMPVDVPGGIDPGVLEVVEVPAGLWARAPGGPRPNVDDPALHAMAQPDGALTVIVGAPGERVPGAEPLAGLLRALAVDGHPTPVVARYGNVPMAPLADCLDAPLLVQHGLLLDDVDGRPVVTCVDVGRGGRWQPLAVWTVYPPAGPPRPARWRAPAPDLAPLGEGRYHLVEGWTVRIVPSGLALSRAGTGASSAHCADEPPHGHLEAPWLAAEHDPGWCEFWIGPPVPGGLPDGVLTALGRLADALPAAVRVRLRIRPPAGTAVAEAQRIRWAIPAPQRAVPPAAADRPRSPEPPEVPEPPDGLGALRENASPADIRELSVNCTEVFPRDAVKGDVEDDPEISSPRTDPVQTRAMPAALPPAPATLPPAPATLPPAPATVLALTAGGRLRLVRSAAAAR